MGYMEKERNGGDMVLEMEPGPWSINRDLVQQGKDTMNTPTDKKT